MYSLIYKQKHFSNCLCTDVLACAAEITFDIDAVFHAEVTFGANVPFGSVVSPPLISVNCNQWHIRNVWIFCRFFTDGFVVCLLHHVMAETLINFASFKKTKHLILRSDASFFVNCFPSSNSNVM